MSRRGIRAELPRDYILPEERTVPRSVLLQRHKRDCLHSLYMGYIAGAIFGAGVVWVILG